MEQRESALASTCRPVIAAGAITAAAAVARRAFAAAASGGSSESGGGPALIFSAAGLLAAGAWWALERRSAPASAAEDSAAEEPQAAADARAAPPAQRPELRHRAERLARLQEVFTPEQAAGWQEEMSWGVAPAALNPAFEKLLILHGSERPTAMKHELGFMRPRWGTGAEPWVPVPLQLTGAAGTWIGIPANVAAELGIAEGSAQEVSVGGSVAYGRATILHAPARYVELSMGAVQALLAAGVGVATWD